VPRAVSRSTVEPSSIPLKPTVASFPWPLSANVLPFSGALEATGLEEKLGEHTGDGADGVMEYWSYGLMDSSVKREA